MNFKRGLSPAESLGVGLINSPEASLEHAITCLEKMGYLLQISTSNNSHTAWDPEYEFARNIRIFNSPSQKDLVQVMGRFTPMIVKMTGE